MTALRMVPGSLSGKESPLKSAITSHDLRSVFPARQRVLQLPRHSVSFQPERDFRDWAIIFFPSEAIKPCQACPMHGAPRTETFPLKKQTTPPSHHQYLFCSSGLLWLASLMMLALPAIGHAADGPATWRQFVSNSAARTVGVLAEPWSTLGVIVGEGQVATVCHLLSATDSYTVRYGMETFPAQLIAADEDRNVCLLQTPDFHVPPVEFGDSQNVLHHQPAYAFSIGKPGEIRPGFLKLIGRTTVTGGTYMFLEPSLPLNDGGGLFDQFGKLLGLIVMDEGAGNAQVLALPVEWIASVQHRLPRPKRPLGAVPWFNKARADDLRGDRSRLLQDLLGWTSARPQSAWAFNGLGGVYVTANHVDQAVQAYERAVALDPEAALILSNLGNAYLTQGRKEEALASFQKALRLDPTEGLAWTGLARTYQALGRKDDAIAALKTASRHGSRATRSGALERLGRAYEDGPLAVETLEEALRVDPTNGDAFGSLGTALVRRGETGKAIAMHEAAVSRHPRQAQAWYNLGTTYASARQVERSMTSLLTALTLDPEKDVILSALTSLPVESPTALKAIRTLQLALTSGGKGDRPATLWEALAWAYSKNGQPAEAENNLRKALEIAPTSQRAWRHLGELQLAGGRFDEARHAFDKWLALEPMSSQARTLLALACARSGDKDKALALAVAATAMSGDANTWIGVALVFEALEMPQKTSDALQQGLLLDPKNVQGLSLHAALEAKRGNIQGAIASYRQAITNMPTHVFSLIELGILLNEDGKSAEARPFLQRANDLEPWNRNASINLGVSFIRTNDAAAAANLFERLRRENPQDTLVLANLVSAYRRSDRMAEALAAYDALNKLDPVMARTIHRLELDR